VNLTEEQKWFLKTKEGRKWLLEKAIELDSKDLILKVKDIISKFDD